MQAAEGQVRAKDSARHVQREQAMPGRIQNAGEGVGLRGWGSRDVRFFGAAQAVGLGHSRHPTTAKLVCG